MEISQPSNEYGRYAAAGSRRVLLGRVTLSLQLVVLLVSGIVSLFAMKYLDFGPLVRPDHASDDRV